MDTLKKVSKQWWFFWVTAGTYLLWSVSNTLHAYIIAIGRDGWKALDSFDVIVMSLATISSTCMTLRALMNGEYNKASNVNVKAGTENATKVL